ncbi:MAG: phage/plasmid primase, P4 family [Oscillospiraceae bacterium]|nr:phage/plasmid primase, P4 family [Oscillospiraceae bacterium]
MFQKEVIDVEFTEVEQTQIAVIESPKSEVHDEMSEEEFKESLGLPKWLEVDEKGKITINEVAFCKEFCRGRTLKCIGGIFYDMGGEIGDEIIAHEISNILTKHVFTGVASKVKCLMGALKLQCYSELPEVKEHEIHVANGVLKTGSGFVSERQFCVNRLNVQYDSAAQSPVKFLNFLSDLLEPDDTITLQEYLGYLLIPSTKGQAMMSIIGEGGEGKSVLGTILKDIFSGNMCVGNFRRIETDRFFRANLKGKLLFLDDDLQLEALPTTGYIKSLITVQIPTDIEFKGKQSYSEKLYARFLCFGNGSIKSLHDKSAGFSRRMIILSTKQISENWKTNPNLAQEIIAEKDGVFAWMFAGLRRLIANNYQFSLSEKSKHNAVEMMSDNCNIIEFLGDKNAVILSNNTEISSTNLYGSYSKWCSDNAMTAVKREAFVSWLKSNQRKYSISYDYNIVSENGKRVRGFKGISATA